MPVHLQDFNRAPAASVRPGAMRAGDKTSPERSSQSPLIAQPRIALLPPVGRKARSAEAIVSSALVDDITMGLCAMRSVSVVAPHTADRLRAKPDWPVDLEQNEVQYVLDARSSPEGLLLYLVFLPTDTILWAARYVLDLDGLANRRQEIASAVISQLAQELERNEVFHADYMRNHQAYHLYLQGMERLKRVTLTDALWARSAFQRALEECKIFPPALSGLSRTFTMEWLLRGESARPLLRDAETTASEAIRHNPVSPLGHRELGVARLYQGDIDGSVEALSTAVELGPHYADAIYSLADSLVHASRPAEGLATIERALSLNFLPPDMYLWSAAGACFFVERYEEAIGFIRRMKVSAPAARLAAAAWGMLGNAEEADAERRRALQLNPSFDLETWLSNVPIKERWQKDMYRNGLQKAGF